MPKNTIIPAMGGPGPTPPVPEQSIRFDRARATNLRGYVPINDTEIDQWTVTCWVKLTGDVAVNRVLWEARIDATNLTRLSIDAQGRIQFEAIIGGVTEAQMRSSQNLRDVSGWVFIYLGFNSGSLIALRVNGYPWNNFDITPQFFTPGNWAWLNSAAEHFIGSSGVNTDNLSAQVAEFHCVGGSNPLDTAFGVFDANGVWDRIVYAGGHGGRGFYLPFSRTIDLGEDFSGLNHDFPTHTNGGAADQFGDWIERNYCILDVNDTRTTGTVTEGGLDVAGGVAAVTMRPHFGVWYYEFNGVGQVWDTGVSGDFDPILVAGSYNFGQLPFVGVGPGGGEMTVNSNNFPATSTDNARDYVATIEWSGTATDPRIISIGDGQSTVYDTEYADIIHRSDLVWAKNIGPGENWYQAHRLRPAAQLPINTVGAEETVNANGVITNLEDPGPGFEVTDGATDNVNFNEFGNVYNCLSLHVKAYGINILVVQDDDTAEEEVFDPASGNTDTSSSDLEMVLEGSDPVQEVGVRFQNVPIPQGSQIVEARIQFEADDTNAGADDMLMFCEDIDDAPVFVDAAANFNITNRTKTSPGIAWSPAAWNTVQERAPAQLTSSFGDALQDVVDRGGWAPGNSIVWIVAEDPSGTLGEREAEAQVSSGENVPELQVRYRSPGAEADSLVSLFTYEGIGKERDVMHGNNNVPELIALKNLGGNDWVIQCSAIQTAGNPEDGRLSFNNTGAFAASVDWDNTPAGGTFFRVGTPNRVNEAGEDFAGFTIASLPGFSKVFRYVGNGNVDGPQVYLGFKPRFLVVKRTQVASNWVTMMKVTRIISALSNQQNLMASMGFLNTTDNFNQNAEAMDAYSHGFKIRSADTDVNAAGAEYIGFAFAEASFPLAKGVP